jgi:pyrroline-5-carboxylate reductase
MTETGLTSFSHHTIGIIGAGHLGRSIAELLTARGFPQDHILLSYAGSPATLAALHEAGLERNITSNVELCRRSSIIFITVRPQAVLSLDGLPFPRTRLVVSCMTGIPPGQCPENGGGLMLFA